MKKILLLVLLLAQSALADRALVIGIDRYPYLRRDATLRGAVNDARLMAERLTRLGFKVEVLTDEQARLESIRQAFAREKSELKPNERFVFYFAGHGTLADQPYLLPFDSRENTFQLDLSEKELHKLLGGLPAEDRTVVLDACFSESFLSSRGLGLTQRSRFYSKAPSRGLGPQGDQPVMEQEPVIYFVASRENEGAREDEFEGAVHGVFTYYLASALLQPRPTWGSLQAAVSARVAQHLEDQQHPTLSAGACRLPVFGGDPPPPEKPVASNLWELFHADQADPSRLSLAMAPDRSALAVGEKLRFTVQIGTPGYLVLLEHGVSGKIQRLYPLSNNLEAARVNPGKVEIPGSQQAFAPDRPGVERVRAFLLESPEEARQLLEAYQTVDGADYQAFARCLEGREVTPGPNRWTSELNFEVRL